MADAYPKADFRALLQEFVNADVRFLVVGAYAVGAHGHFRYTGDLDLWIEASPQNAERAYRALVRFGAPLFDLTTDDLARPGVVFQVGVPPSRIDILNDISGISFPNAWPSRMLAPVEGFPVPVIGLQDLIVNKRASGRDKDLLDLKALERIARRKKP